MPLRDYLDVGEEAAKTAMQFPFGPQTALNAAPGQDWEGMADIAGNVGMGALELGNAPFEVVGETIRGAGESEPLKMASESDQSGYRWPSIVQRLAPSTRTEHPPADPFMKAYQGLEGLVNLPTQGLQGASDIVTGEPDIAAQLGGLGIGLGIMPLHPEKMAAPELPEYLKGERGSFTLGPEPKPELPAVAAPSPWYSRIDKTFQEKLPEQVDPGQMKNILSTLPKEEAEWRGINEFIEQQHGPVPKAEVMEQLKKTPVEIGEKKLAGTREDYRTPQTRRPRTLGDESDLGFEDYPSDVQEKAEQLQREAADRALEDSEPYDPGEGYGVEPIDRSQEEIGREAGEKDLFGEEIKPLPDKYIVKYAGEPVMHDDLSQWNAKHSIPNEEGHAVFSDEGHALDAYYSAIEDDELNFRDEQYRDWLNDNPPENYLEDAKAEVGYVYEPEDMEFANADEARNAFNQGTHDIYDESDDLVQSLADITANQEYRMLPVEGEPIPRLPAGQAPPGMPPRPGAGPTKYETYSTPGGQNYREVLMTLPSKRAAEEARIAAENARQNASGVFTNIEPSETKIPDDFQSGHWDEPNVLAHIRFKDFADPATGKKTLLIDEIQSDWHQKGRAEGYRDAASLEAKNKMRENDHIIAKAEEEAANIRFGYKDEAKTMDKDAFNAMLYQKEPRYSELMTDWTKAKNENVALAKIAGGNVPDAPFKKNWQELAFKRALQEAVEGGYDEMAWTTGEHQADRYNLAKQVSSIEYNKEPTGDYYVTATGNNGRTIEIGNHPAARLPDVVGKELADKIIAGHGEPSPSEALQRLRARGDPTGVIKKGDSWYITFKSKELPEDARAVRLQNGDWWVSNPDGKDLSHGQFPTKEEAIEAAKGQHFGTYLSKEDALNEAKSIKDMIRADDRKSLSGLDLKIGGEGMKGFYDQILPSFANKYLKKYGVKVGETSIATSPGLVEHNPDAAFEKVHSIPITPEMKADILGKGQPMWQVPALVGAGAAGAAAGSEQDQQNFAHGGIVQEESDMPFQSEAQRGFMYAKHPKIAKRFEEETPKNAKLPEHVKKMNQGGIVGDWKDDLAGYMDQHFSGKKNSPQSMADGGIAGDDYEVDLGDTSTARGASYSPPPMPSLAPAFSPHPTFDPMAGLPPPAAPLAAMSPVAAPPPIARRPAGPSGPDPALQGYLNQQREDLNKYGPEEQLALEKSLQERRHGVVPVLANAATGFADAIMQGVAQQGPGHFQENLENRLDKSEEGQRQALSRAQAGHLSRMKQQMELAQMDPTSPISRLAQRSGSHVLKALGLSDDEIQHIPANLIGEAQTKGLSLEEIRSRAKLAEAVQGNTAAYQGATIGMRREELDRAREKEAFEEAEKTAARQRETAKDTLALDKAPKIHIFGSDIPYAFSPISRADRRGSRDVLRGQPGGVSPVAAPGATNFPSEAAAKASGLPPGSIIKINGRRARLK